MRRPITAVVLLVALARAHLAAQVPAKPIPDGPAIGVTADRYSFDRTSLTMVTLHLSALKHNSFSSEFALGVFPTALASGVVVTSVDVGGARNFSYSGATVLLRLGASGLFALSPSGGGGAFPAVHAGASALFAVGPQTAIRFDFTHRSFLIPYEGLMPTFSVGVGISGLPRL